jgi:hypothetical protein
MTRIFALFAMLFGLSHATAGEPWRHIPEDANLVLVVEKPQVLIESIRSLPPYSSIQKLPAIQELLQGTNIRRFEQLLAYYEREMGEDWPKLVEQIAGEGIAIGTVVGMDPAPALFVIQGQNEKAVTQFFTLALKALEEELQRENPAAKLERKTQDGIERAELGKDFFVARRGATILFANHPEAMKRGLATNHKTMPAKWKRAETITRKACVAPPIAWIAFDLAKAKESQASQDFFANTRQDVLQNLVVGSSIDAVRRADLLAIGLYRSRETLEARILMPAKRAELPPEFTLHVPPVGTPGSLPLLEPAGVAYSQSFTLDLATFWREREKFVNAQQLPDLEKFNTEVSKLISGPSFGKLLEMSGPYHRFVVLSKSELPYKTLPSTVLPPMALVSAFRDPKFAKPVTAALRGGAFAASLATGMTLSEETFEGVKIVSYKFPENRELPGDADNLRYNFMPSFAVVEQSLIVASEPSVIRALIPELRKPVTADASAPVWRGQAFAKGVAELGKNNPDPITTNLILTRNLGLDAAKAETKQILAWLETLGHASFEIDHKTNYYEAKFTWALPKTGK